MTRQQKDKKKTNREKEIQTKRHKEQLDSSMNRFLNAGSPVANILKIHIINHLDPVIIEMRVIRAGIMDLRHYAVVLPIYQKQYDEGPILIRNKHGLTMSKEELQQEISEISNIRVYVKLMDVKSRIVNKLLPMIDDVFLSEQYEEFVLDCIHNVGLLGYELFPKKIELVKM